MNLFLISLDTLRFDALGAAPDQRLWGDLRRWIETPTLDRLCVEGTLIPRMVTTCPYTSPSHATLFTGCHWPLHGVVDLFTTRMQERVVPLAEHLQQAGWRTGINAGRGWRSGHMFAMEQVNLARGFQHRAWGGWLRRSTRRWLTRKESGKPWFLFFHTMQVHRPYGLSRRRLGRLLARDLAAGDGCFEGLRTAYLRNLARVDRKLGQLLRWMDKRGLLQDTLVVLLSDHGEGLCEHGITHGNVGGWHEGVVRVPFIITGPGIPGGSLLDVDVSTVDVAPTLAEMLGHPLSLQDTPPLWVGRDLSRWVRQEAPPEELPDRACWFFGSLPDPSLDRPMYAGLLKEGWKYVSWWFPPGTLERERARRERLAGKRRKLNRWYNQQVLIRQLEAGQLEALYQPRSDPFERQDLSEQAPEVATRLRAELDQWLAGASGPLPDRTAHRDDAEVRRHLSALGYLDE